MYLAHFSGTEFVSFCLISREFCGSREWKDAWLYVCVHLPAHTNWCIFLTYYFSCLSYLIWEEWYLSSRALLKIKKLVFSKIFKRPDQFSSVQFSRSVVSSSLQPHRLQRARPLCPSPSPGVYPNSCPSSRWCNPTISSSVNPFSSRRQSFPASGSFPMSQLFASGDQRMELQLRDSELLKLGSSVSLPLCGFPGSSAGKESGCNAETPVRFLGWEDPLEKGMATHSSILAWRIPWTV